MFHPEQDGKMSHGIWRIGAAQKRKSLKALIPMTEQSQDQRFAEICF